MKCSKLYQILIKDGWFAVSQKGSHIKMRHDFKDEIIIFPNHGSQEMGKGLENKILKDARVKLSVMWRIRQSYIFGQVEAKNHSIAVATESFFNEEMA